MNKNILLPQLENSTLNAGFVHILGHKSVAVRRFGNRYKGRANHYSNRISIRFDQWQENLAKYKAPNAAGMMTHADLGSGSSREQFIPLTEHGCASQMISEDIMKRSMGSREGMAEFVADMVELAINRGAYEIDKKFMRDICNFNNYKDGSTPNESTAIFINSEDDYKPGKDANGMEKIRKLRNSMTSIASAMCWPSNKFNKFGLISTSFNAKRLGVIISDEMKGQFRDYYGNVFNVEYADLEKEFAWVETMPIHNYNKHIIFISEDGYVLDIDEESATGFDNSRNAFRETWFYKWLDAFQEVAHGTNLVCWAVDPKSLPKKDLEKDFKDIDNSFTKTQAKAWKDKGFTYDQVKDWINIGIKPADTDYVDWLVKVKKGDYANPDWYLNNADDIALHEEFSKV